MYIIHIIIINFTIYFILVYLVLVISLSFPVVVHDCRLLDLSVLSYFYVAQSHPLYIKEGTEEIFLVNLLVHIKNSLLNINDLKNSVLFSTFFHCRNYLLPLFKNFVGCILPSNAI